MSETIKQDIQVTFDNEPYSFFKGDRVYGYMVPNDTPEIVFNNSYYYKVSNLSVSLTCHQRDMYEKSRRYSLIPYGQGDAGFVFTERYIDISFAQSVDVTKQFNVEINSDNYFKEVTAFQPIGFLLFEEVSAENEMMKAVNEKERELNEEKLELKAELPSEITLSLIPAKS